MPRTVYSIESHEQALGIWRRMRRSAKYLRVPSLAKALEVLNKPNMQKLLVYLDKPDKRLPTRLPRVPRHSEHILELHSWQSFCQCNEDT
ncbi:hypothetical protein N9061_02525 [bacterium]|nr:hypothetical protein [Mariniblastus sp.]MDB4483999.1 hypothetical protein [bacterium]